jgi:flagellar motor switch protein FliN/FliY
MTNTAKKFDLLKDIDVRLTVELGRTNLKLKELLALGEDSVVTLDKMSNELLEVLVNGTLIARGEVVTQGDRFGLRIVELVSRAGEDEEAEAA